MIPLRDSQPSSSRPIVTSLIIAVNVFVFLFELSLDDFSLNHFIAAFGVVPASLRLDTLFTSMFIHGGWMHLIGNMWFLWIYGNNIEDILGRVKYVLFYLLCGVAAALAQVALSLDSHVPIVGASGAIAGVMGAYMIKFPHARIMTLLPIFLFFTTVELPAYVILLYWFVLQFFSGIGSIASSQLDRGGVAFMAHVGGFVAGIVLIFLLRPRDRYQRRSDLQW